MNHTARQATAVRADLTGDRKPELIELIPDRQAGHRRVTLRASGEARCALPCAPLCSPYPYRLAASKSEGLSTSSPSSG
jgi:hypothetical protein